MKDVAFLCVHVLQKSRLQCRTCVCVCVWMLFSNQPQKWRDCCPLLEVAVEPGSSLSDDGESQKTTYPLTEAETGPPSTRPAPLSLSLLFLARSQPCNCIFGGRRWNVARCKNCGSLLLMAALSYLNAGEEMKLIGSQSNGDVVDLQAAWV